MRFVEVAPGRVELRQGPPPALLPGQARVRVRACGICGTDLHLLHGLTLPRGAGYPVRPGHEVAGTVVELADPVPPGAPAVNDLVVLHPVAPCGRCAECAAGRAHQCDDATTLGIHAPGGLADEVVWPMSRMAVANGLPPAEAAVLADAGATAYRSWREAAVAPGGALCVLGAGGVGTQLLKIAQALDRSVTLAAVVGSAASAQRVAALQVHAEVGVAGVARRLRQRFGRFDAVADFTGSPDAPAEGIRLLRRGGRLIFGSVLDAELRLGPATTLQARELHVLGVYSSGIDDLRQVVEIARTGLLDLAGTVTHRFPIEETADALALVEERPPGMLRVAVTPTGPTSPL